MTNAQLDGEMAKLRQNDILGYTSQIGYTATSTDESSSVIEEITF